MRLGYAFLVMLLVAGCTKAQPPTTHMIDDGAEDNVDGFADLLWAEFRELNGSVVLWMEYENMSGRIPEFTATFDVITDQGQSTWFLRNQPNFSKPPTNLEYVVGRVQNNEYVVAEQVCALTEIRHGPWYLRIEAEHRVTGLTGGGRIRGLEIQTSDFENHPQDHARTDAVFEVRGGPNPHDQCPLLAERE